MKRLLYSFIVYLFALPPAFSGPIIQSTYFDYDIGGYFQIGFFVDGLVQPDYLDGQYLEWSLGAGPTYGIFDGVYGLDTFGWGDDPWFRTSFDSNGFIKHFAAGFSYSSGEGNFSFNQDNGKIVDSSSGGYNYTYTYDFTATGYSSYDCRDDIDIVEKLPCGVEDIGRLYPVVVPLPAGILLLLTSLVALFGLGLRKRRLGTTAKAAC